MFIIMHSSGLYFHNKGKIILFDSQEQAKYFLNAFIQYSTNEFSKQGDIGMAMHAPMTIMQECKIMLASEDIRNEKVKCGVVYARDLMQRM